jgi:hypothetical protein
VLKSLPQQGVLISGDIAFHERLLAIDQSAYAHLNTFEELAVKNAGRLFQTMEMEAF